MNLSKSKMQKYSNLKEVHFPETYEEILNEAEIIGIMLGDGHIYPKGYGIRLRVKEFDFCKNFKDLVEKTYKIKGRMDYKNYYNYYAYGRLFVKRISDFTNNNKEIPKFILNGNDKIKSRFLRGFFDSEGSMDVIYNRRQIVLTQKNKEILLQIKYLL